MEIALHIGANCTDNEALISSVLRNKDELKKHGVLVPNPDHYRRILRETLQQMYQDKTFDPASRGKLLDAMGVTPDTRRVVLSNPDFICIPNRIFENGKFYWLVEEKIGGFNQIFAEDDVTVFLGMRNPATFLPAVFAESKYNDIGNFMQGVDVSGVRWSLLIQNIQNYMPEPVVAWCNEDTPFIWSQLMRSLCGVPAGIKMVGKYDLLSEIMTEAGVQKFFAYMKQHPPKSESQRAGIISAFLSRYGLEGKIVDEVSVPGWTTDTVEMLSDLYEADVAQVELLEDVTLVAP